MKENIYIHSYFNHNYTNKENKGMDYLNYINLINKN